MSRPCISRTVQAARRLHSSAPLDPITPAPLASTSSSIPSSSSTASSSRLPPLLPAATPSAPSSLPSTTSTSSALSLIAAQSTPSTGRYLLARLHSRTYLLHPRDVLTVPQLKPAPAPGSTLALTRILEVGSRDWSLRSQAAEGKVLRRLQGTPSRDGQVLPLPESLLAAGADGQDKSAAESIEGWEQETIPAHVARCELTVLEHTKSPLERIVKSKRRKGYKKTIEHKQGWTRLRVGDIHLGDGAGPSA